MPHCSSHEIFQDMFKQGLANLSEKLSDIALALKEQNEAFAKKMDNIVESQGERRELCGRRGAQIVALQQSDSSQWEELRRQRENNAELSRVVWKREGILIAASAVISFVMTCIAKFFLVSP